MSGAIPELCCGRGMRIYRIVWLIALAGLLASCAGTLPRDVLPRELTDGAAVVDLPEVRFWGDEKSRALDLSLSSRVDQALVSGRAAGVAAGKPATLSYLALSGGGSDGAFGAGLLVGWTEHRTRPTFEIVTGVSTGALMAPFAFLGPEYDPQIKEIYTTLSTKQLVSYQVFSGLFGGDALADSSPLAKHIARFVDAKLLAAIAAEHRKGRRLFVATTNIDAERPVIWDMGAIAQSTTPKSLEIFRNVLLASASIPGAFPPVRIRVKAGGREFEELHVDGGITSQVFFLPFEALLYRYTDRKIAKRQLSRRLFVIRNTKVTPEWQAVQDKTLPIVERSLSTLIKSQGVGDLYKLYLEAQLQQMDFNYGAIPADFSMKSTEFFDLEYMNALFVRGYELGRQGYVWQKHPPGMSGRIAHDR